MLKSLPRLELASCSQLLRLSAQNYRRHYSASHATPLGQNSHLLMGKWNLWPLRIKLCPNLHSFPHDHGKLACVARRDNAMAVTMSVLVKSCD